MKFAKQSIIAVAVGALLVASVAQAQPRHRAHRGDLMERAQELGLTEDQKSKIKELLHSARKDGIELRAKLQLAQLELKKLMQDENADISRIESQSQAVHKLKSSQQVARIKTHRAMQAVLTPEQREKAKTLRASKPRVRKFRERRERGMRHMRERRQMHRPEGPGERGPGAERGEGAI